MTGPQHDGRLDIMLPFYGRVDHLQLAVRSVLAQTDPNWCLTVVDDGYPDPDVADWFADLGDPRVTYRRNEVNLGANENYRLCLDLVLSDWFVMMGADDLMLPGYVARTRQLALNHPEAGIVHPGVRVVDEDGQASYGLVERAKAAYRPRARSWPYVGRGEAMSRNLVRGDWMYFPAICWNRQAAQEVGFRPGLDVVQDLALALDVLETGRVLVLDDEVTFEYRRHAGSDSSWRALEGSRFLEQGRFFASQAARYRARGWSSAARAAELHVSSRAHAATMILSAIRRGRWDGVRNLARHALT